MDTKPNRKDLRKLKSIHTDLNNVMSKIAGLSLETERSIRKDSKKIEEARVNIKYVLSLLYEPL